MKLILLFFIIFFIGCEKEKDEKKILYNDRTYEEIIMQSKKKNDISIFFYDSIHAGRTVRESFLNFKLGDSKIVTENKIKDQIRQKKLRKNRPFGTYELLLYKMELRNRIMDFKLEFDYSTDLLYSIQLTYFEPLPFNSPINSWDKEEIISLYKDKYKNNWYIDNYIPIGSSVEYEQYENLEGTRYISLTFTERTLYIIYKDIKLENREKTEKSLKTKTDI